MTYRDPRDPNRQNPQTRAYTQNQAYTQGQAYSGYPDDQTGAYRPAPQQSKRPAARRGPDLDPVLFSGGVLATGVVTGLAAWLVAWIVRTVSNKVTESGQLGIWNPLDQSEYWFALVGFLTALFAGALWYVLQLATPAPDAFYRWIVGLLIAAAVIIPLAASEEISKGIGTAILHLCIGVPVLILIPTMGSHSRRRN